MMRASRPRHRGDSAFLFDMDGVLIDTTELHQRLWTAFAREHDYAPTPAELAATNGRPAAETIAGWWGALDAPTVTRWREERESLFDGAIAGGQLAPIAGAPEFVAALTAAGVAKAVATSSGAASAELALSSVGLRTAFPVVVTAADVRRGKPDPECYLTAAERLGFAPDRCIVVEDSLHGIRAAKAAGMQCVALATSFAVDVLRHERPDWILPDLRHVPTELWR
jgi:HAD superfamily hydrolase (TIGR01509 family)